MAERMNHFYHKKNKCPNRYRKISPILLVLVVILVNVIGRNNLVHATEYGGFDVSTGIGDFGDDWSDWDEENGNLPEQDNSYGTSEDTVADSGNLYDAQDSAGTEESTQTWNNETVNEYREYSAAAETEARTQNDREQSEQYRNQAGDQTETASNSSRQSQDSYGTSEEILQETDGATEIPSETPTPTVTPLPTFTVTPAFTEVPKAEEKTVTEYNGEYQIPPAECLKKMKLYYWQRKITGGESIEISLNHKLVAAVVSFRINHREIIWKKENGQLRADGMNKNDSNQIELAVMVPADLPWTEAQKNVILTYNVF